MATRGQHFFLPNSGYSGNQSRGGAGRGGAGRGGAGAGAGAALLLNCRFQRHGRSNKEPGRVVSLGFFPLNFICRTHANSCNSTLWRVMSSVVGANLKKEAGVGIPTTRSLGDQGTFQSSPIPEVPAAFGCSRLGLAAGGPPSPPPAPPTPTHTLPELEIPQVLL